MEISSNILLIIIVIQFLINIIISVVAYYSLKNKTGPIGPRGIQGPRGIDK